MIRIAWYAALVLATLMVLVLLWHLSTAVVMFLLSLAVAAAFRPLVEELRQRGVPKGVAVAISFGLPFSVLIGLFLAASAPLIAELQQATDDLLLTYESLRDRWIGGTDPLRSSLVEQLPRPKDLYAGLTDADSSVAIQALFGAAEGTLEFLARMVIVLVLSLYWSIDQVRFERLWLSLLPVDARARARSIWYAIESGVGAFLRREVSLSLVAAVVLWLGYQLLGVEYPTLLAVIGALARLIPWLGPILMVIFPLPAGSALGWWAAGIAATYTLLTFALLEATLGTHAFSQPRYSSLLLVIVMVALADSYGLLGAVLAPVLAVALQILFKSILPVYANGSNEAPLFTLSGLQAEIERIARLASAPGRPHCSETANLLDRLQILLDKSSSSEC